MTKSLQAFILVFFIAISSAYSYNEQTDIITGKLEVANTSTGTKYYYIKYNDKQQTFFNLLQTFLKDAQIITPYPLHKANDNNPYGYHTTVTKDNFKLWDQKDQIIEKGQTFRFRVVDGIHIFTNKAEDGTTTIWFVQWLEPYGDTAEYFTNIFNENGSELHASIAYYQF